MTTPPEPRMAALDPVCVFHGKRRSEHRCLVCCLCFRDLTPAECNVRPDGTKEDVCVECARLEAEVGAREAREIAKRLLRDLPNHPKATLVQREDFEAVARALLAAEQRAEEAERERDELLSAMRGEHGCGFGQVAMLDGSRQPCTVCAALAPHKAAEEETDG